MNVWFAVGMMWVSVSAAVIAGMYLTESAWPLLAFILPTAFEVKEQGKKP